MSTLPSSAVPYVPYIPCVPILPIFPVPTSLASWMQFEAHAPPYYTTLPHLAMEWIVAHRYSSLCTSDIVHYWLTTLVHPWRNWVHQYVLGSDVPLLMAWQHMHVHLLHYIHLARQRDRQSLTSISPEACLLHLEASNPTGALPVLLDIFLRTHFPKLLGSLKASMYAKRGHWSLAFFLWTLRDHGHTMPSFIRESQLATMAQGGYFEFMQWEHFEWKSTMRASVLFRIIQYTLSYQRLDLFERAYTCYCTVVKNADPLSITQKTALCSMAPPECTPYIRGIFTASANANNNVQPNNDMREDADGGAESKDSSEDENDAESSDGEENADGNGDAKNANKP